ncbi:MAG: hypothetical protein GC201_17965 [Alphaproteobacteria bacterium]|nr:hypothetical protein [Alphaproteobacteria bacterium]
MTFRHLKPAGLVAAGAIVAALLLWTPGNAQSPNNGLAFSNGWIPVGMNTTGDPALPSVAWFYNRDDGRVVSCRHAADDNPPVCSPPAHLP